MSSSSSPRKRELRFRPTSERFTNAISPSKRITSVRRPLRNGAVPFMPFRDYARPTSNQNEMDADSKSSDLSSDFVECLKSITKRDFEHLHATVAETMGRERIRSESEVFELVSPSPFTSPSGVDPSSHPITPSSSRPTATINRETLVESFTMLLDAMGKPRPVSAPSAQRALNNRREKGRSVGRPFTPVLVDPRRNTVSNQNRKHALTKSKVPTLQLEHILQKDFLKKSENVEEEDEDSSVTDDDDTSCPSTSAPTSSKRVTFASDVVNHERENKPSRRKRLNKRRRIGFPHPIRGIFVPPSGEIVESNGPEGMCKDILYLTFTEVWTQPAARTSAESVAGRTIRLERFHQLMSDLEHAHVHYNSLTNNIEQNDYLTECIFKRYILVLDIALMEGHLTQVEHLLETISKSAPVLNQNTFYLFQNSKDFQHEKREEENEIDMSLVNFALGRISGGRLRHDCCRMCIETVLVKLCLELVELVFSPHGSQAFRSSLNTIPYTVRTALLLMRESRSNEGTFSYIRWVNNSAVQRDYRSILKNLGMMDQYGPKLDGCTFHQSHNIYTRAQTPVTGKRPVSPNSKRLIHDTISLANERNKC